MNKMLFSMIGLASAISGISMFGMNSQMVSLRTSCHRLPKLATSAIRPIRSYRTTTHLNTSGKIARDLNIPKVLGRQNQMTREERAGLFYDLKKHRYITVYYKASICALSGILTFMCGVHGGFYDMDQLTAFLTLASYDLPLCFHKMDICANPLLYFIPSLAVGLVSSSLVDRYAVHEATPRFLLLSGMDQNQFESLSISKRIKLIDAFIGQSGNWPAKEE